MEGSEKEDEKIVAPGVDLYFNLILNFIKLSEKDDNNLTQASGRIKE